jgi:predicted HAD superfamily hydrolase
MLSTTQELQRFGYRFLGPVVTAFFDGIVEKSGESEEPRKLFFLAREGYFLKQLYSQYCAMNGYDEIAECEYLLCSRAFLFKLALTDETLVPLTLQHHYSGTLSNFICRRYGFNGSDLNRIAKELPHLSKALKSEVKLPSQAEQVSKSMLEVASLFQTELDHKKELYLCYLDRIGFNVDELSVVDIGFSGTIQTLLSALTGRKITGHYMVTTEKAIDTENCIFYGHFSSNQAFGGGYALLDRSLYLESMLTAPHGQVIDIFQVNGDIQFTYAGKTQAQHNFEILEQVAQGAQQYMTDVLPERLQLTAQEVPGFYASLIKDPGLFPEGVHSILEVDDHISGFGILNPAKLFG